jgi:hypothetical protein
MSNSLVKIEQILQDLNVDITQIVKYTKKINDIGNGFNKMLAPIYLRDFIMAYDLTSQVLLKVTKADIDADSALKMAEAIAYLDRAKAYLDQREIKDSAEARKRYIPLDPDVIIASETKAKTEAMVAFLKNKLATFRISHDDVKKIAYADEYQSPNEGMR